MVFDFPVDPQLESLLRGLLEKNPNERMTMQQIKVVNILIWLDPCIGLITCLGPRLGYQKWAISNFGRTGNFGDYRTRYGFLHSQYQQNFCGGMYFVKWNLAITYSSSKVKAKQLARRFHEESRRYSVPDLSFPLGLPGLPKFAMQYVSLFLHTSSWFSNVLQRIDGERNCGSWT